MPRLLVPHVPLNEARGRVWDTRLQLMSECSCPCRKRDDGFTTTGVDKFSDGEGGEHVIAVHAACGLPVATLLAEIIQECDSCEQWYIQDEIPDRNFYCRGCD